METIFDEASANSRWVAVAQVIELDVQWLEGWGFKSWSSVFLSLRRNEFIWYGQQSIDLKGKHVWWQALAKLLISTCGLWTGSFLNILPYRLHKHIHTKNNEMSVSYLYSEISPANESQSDVNSYLLICCLLSSSCCISLINQSWCSFNMTVVLISICWHVVAWCSRLEEKVGKCGFFPWGAAGQQWVQECTY